MEEAVTEKKTKSILRPKTSKMPISAKSGKHTNILIDKNTYESKTEKTKKNIQIQENLLLSKFDFVNDYMRREAKEFKIKLNNLNNINLFEKKIDDLYDWGNLFNNFKPISSYISLKKSIETKHGRKKRNKNLEEYGSPIVLVDLPESEMNLFFGRNNNYSLSPEKNINSDNFKKSHNIRPVSMYSPREENSCFYYSNTFSDYYKEDFKSFCEKKMPILKAKLKINPDKLRKEIYKKDFSLINKYKLLEKQKDKKSIFNKQDLIIAGKRKNPMPLIKSVFLQKYNLLNNSVENKNEISKNKNENEKILNSYDNINVGTNSNNYNYKFSNRLILSYYDINDPSIALFKDSNIKSFNNYPNKNIKVYKSNEISSKEDKEEQKATESDDKQQQQQNKSKIPMKSEFSTQINNTTNTNIEEAKYTSIKKRKLTTKKLKLNNDNLFQEEYIPPNSFPLKTSSNVGNASYNKIKKIIKDKQFLNKFKFNNLQSMPQPMNPIITDKISNDKSDLELILESKKIKPKKNWTFFDSIYDKKNNKKILYKWDKGGNLLKNVTNKNKNEKYNIIYFNKCIKTKFNEDITKLKSNFDNFCFSPINAFNKGEVENYKKKNKKEIENKNNKDIFDDKIGDNIKHDSFY